MRSEKLYKLRTFDFLDFFLVVLICSAFIYYKIFFWPVIIGFIILFFIAVEQMTSFTLFEDYVIIINPLSKNVKILYSEIEKVILFKGGAKGKGAALFHYIDIASGKQIKKKIFFPTRIDTTEFCDILKLKGVKVYYYTGRFSEPEEI